jgi:hypothetical protein
MRTRRPLLASAVAAAALVAIGCGASSGAEAGGVRLQRIGTFAAPVYVTSPPGDRRRVFVVEQGGTIRVLVDGHERRTPFLDIRGKVRAGGEQGLLSMAFAPDYRTSGRFYVDYTDRDGDSRIVEYRRSSRNAARANPRSARQLLFQRQPEANHNGGLLLFGPDRKLYVGFGDGGGGGDRHGAHGNAQSLGTLLGKVLRIDPHRSGSKPYSIPPGNPFAHRAGARPEIWAYGLRNPWRFSFAPGGQLVIGDVGQDAIEEIDVIRGAGVNLGWRVFEGGDRYTAGERAPGAVAPDITRRHRDGWCSITGGLVVRDGIALRGRYLFGDFCAGDIQSARIAGSGVRDVRSTHLHVDGLASFGQDGRGRTYAVSNGGPVYRLVAAR